MSPIEQMRLAKDLIHSKSNGLLQLEMSNWHNQLVMKISRDAIVGVYLSVLSNTETNRYECLFKGYTHCSGGYSDAQQMQKIATEYQTIADLLKELENAKITLSQQELEQFRAEISSEEEQSQSPVMTM